MKSQTGGDCQFVHGALHGVQTSGRFGFIDGIRTAGRYAPRKWVLGHAFHSIILGLCNGRQDHLGPALSANTYL